MTAKERFEADIEDGVLIWVRRLREAGINTECSCGHQGYIQCQSLDPTTDLARIKAVLHEHDLWRYTITFEYESRGKDYADWHQSIEVRSQALVGNLLGKEASDG